MKKLLTVLLASMTLFGCSSATDAANTTETSENINVYTRDSSSGTREAFEKGIGLDDGNLTVAASEVSGNGDMATKVGADNNGIGYVSLTTDFEGNGIKALQFEGVDASIDTVLDGTYSLQRPFNFVTRADNDFESADIQQLVEAFVAYITESQEGLAVIEGAGGIVSYDGAKPWSEIAVDYPVLNNDNSAITIKTGGSTSVEKAISAALTSFQPIAGNVQFAMDQTGSSDGFKRTLGEESTGVNAKDIGFASREFSDTEDVSTGLASGAFCQDAVVVVVNSNNSLTNLTKDQVVGIYSGAVTDFTELN